MNLQLRIDTAALSCQTASLSPRLPSPLLRSPTSLVPPPEAMLLSPSCPSPRLPSLHEGVEVTAFPRLQSIGEGLSDLGDMGTDGLALFTAISDMDAKAASELLTGGVSANISCLGLGYRTPLHELVAGCVLQEQSSEPRKQQLRFIDLLTLLLHHGADLNAVDIWRRTALHVAASSAGHRDIIRVLIASGSKANAVDICGQTPLHIAVLRAGYDDVKTLLDGGADPNMLDHQGLCPVHIAAKRKFHTDTLNLLLKSGGLANENDQASGKPRIAPLHVAVKSGQLDNVRALLIQGASVNLMDSSGQLPLHLAAANDLTGKVLDCLISHGGNVNEQDATYSETPLHKAVKGDMIENFKVLVRRGADPNIRDAQSETALHKACSCTSPFIWTSLIQLGGDPTVRNKAGLTPMDKAVKAKNHLALSMMTDGRQNRDS